MSSSISGAWWTVFRNPAFIARRSLALALTAYASDPRVVRGGVLVDVGCGSKPYEALFTADQYLGLDVEISGHPDADKRCDLYFDGATLPLTDGFANIVLCTQVLEHTPQPKELLEEIARILKPSGVLILTLPFVWEEHEAPYDFFRFTSHGVRNLLDATGFDIVRFRRTSGSADTTAQVLSVWAHRVLGRSVPVWSAVVTAVVCAPIQLAGMLVQSILPEDGELFLDSAVLAIKSEVGAS